MLVSLGILAELALDLNSLRRGDMVCCDVSLLATQHRCVDPSLAASLIGYVRWPPPSYPHSRTPQHAAYPPPRSPKPTIMPQPSRTSDGPQASYQITTINRPLKLRRRSRRPGSAPGMAGQIVPRCCGGLIECGEGCDLNFEGRPASAKLGDCGMRSDLAYHKCQLAYMINMALGLELGRVLRMGWM